MATPAELAHKAESLTDGEWYDFLEALDEVSRRRAKRTRFPDEPPSTDRDTVAQWVAQKHFRVDKNICEIWYLPEDAPDDEIRLVEVSDLAVSPTTTTTADPHVAATASATTTTTAPPMDFGLDVREANFFLRVVDVDSEQLEQIEQGQLCLPDNWSLDAARTWRRRP
jgi:hypothetical protein